MPNRYLESYELYKNAFEFLCLLYCRPVPLLSEAQPHVSLLARIMASKIIIIHHIHQTPIPPARSTP